MSNPNRISLLHYLLMPGSITRIGFLSVVAKRNNRELFTQVSASYLLESTGVTSLNTPRLGTMFRRASTVLRRIWYEFEASGAEQGPKLALSARIMIKGSDVLIKRLASPGQCTSIMFSLRMHSKLEPR